MARHYKQGYNARLDEALGARHGKKKQSYKARRDESKGMEKREGKRAYSGDKSMDRSARMRHHNDEAHREADDTQMNHRGRDYYGVGYGEPSNLPEECIRKKYPEPYSRLKVDYHDTLTGIDDDMMDSFRKVEDQKSDSMY